MWRFTQSEQICEELVQEAFVEAYFSLDSYKFKAPFVFWLKTIATRVGYRLWKRQAKEREIVQIDLVGELEAPTPRNDGEALNRIVHALLSELVVPDRMVLTLLYSEKCSVREIPEHMGWNQAKVKTWAYRARRKLLRIANRMNIWDELEWID